MRPKNPINTFHFLFVFSLLLSFIFPQSLRELKSLNSELDILKSELMDTVEDTESLSVETEDEILEAEAVNAVSLTPPEIIDDKYDLYFGYNYFKSEIDFFANAPDPANYLLGPGDEIIISLWGEMNARESFIINKNGQVFYDGVGFISISNMTIPKAEETLILELGKIYSTLQKDSQSTNLSIELGRLKSINIFVAGMVVKPGINLIHPFSDIFTALVQSGGIDLNGSLRTIQVIRNNEVVSNIDLYEFFNKGNRSGIDFKLLDGDVIYVPPVKNRVKVIGEVLRPGFYELLQTEELNNLIDYAAGLTPKASSVITIDTVKPINERKSQDDIISSLNVDITKDKVFLNNGDLVVAREVGESSSKVEIFGRVKVPGLYSASNMSLKDILNMAGGFDDPIFRKTIREDIVILRKDENQFYSKELVVNYNDADSFSLSIDDKIFVYENINYRNSFTYRIEGEINKPGTYPLKKGITLQEAIDLAGGLTELATADNIVISQEFTNIDLDGNETSRTENVANAPLNFELSQNSVINIIPFENVVSVQGNVYNPGLVAFEKGMTMSSAIIQAGGYKPYSLKKRAYVKRANGEIDKANVFRGRTKRLLPGDTVFVPLNPDPSDFDLTTFIADISTTLANIAAILLIVDNQND